MLSPIAVEVVHRIDALFEVERPINGMSAEERRAVRQTLSKPLVDELQVYMRGQRAKLSRGHDLARAIDYILKWWDAFTLFLNEGVFASQIMPQSAPYAASLWDENLGCSVVLIAVVSELLLCTASLSRQK